jgi:hypothetical protein
LANYRNSTKQKTQKFIIIIIIIFSGYLLTCRLNGTSASYKASTKTQIRHKTVQRHKNKSNMAGNKRYKRSTGAKTLNP